MGERGATLPWPGPWDADMIETPRLRLRRPRVDDIEAVYAYRSRSDVARYLSGGPWSREQTADELATYAAADFTEPGDELVLIVELLADGAVMGDIGLLRCESSELAEIGYVFNPAFGGEGFASEAVSALLTLAFEKWGFARVIARTDADNRASRSLCERLGMGFVGSARSTDGREVEEVTYAIDSPR